MTRRQLEERLKATAQAHNVLATVVQRLELQVIALYRDRSTGGQKPMCACGHPVAFHLDEEIGGLSTGQCIGYVHHEIAGKYTPCECQRCDRQRILGVR